MAPIDSTQTLTHLIAQPKERNENSTRYLHSLLSFHRLDMSAMNNRLRYLTSSEDGKSTGDEASNPEGTTTDIFDTSSPLRKVSTSSGNTSQRLKRKDRGSREPQMGPSKQCTAPSRQATPPMEDHWHPDFPVDKASQVTLGSRDGYLFKVGRSFTSKQRRVYFPKPQRTTPES